MVDMTDLSKKHGSAEAASRLKKRRNAELRLQFYGIFAIFLAGAALVVLLSSVVLNARFALTEAYIVTDVTLEEAEIDPNGTDDPEVIGRASFNNIVRDEFRALFPFVSGRTNRRELADLYSNGSIFELRDQVVADPSLVGQTITFDFLASDVTDLYLKGEFGTLIDQGSDAAITLSFLGDGVVGITADADIFSPALALVRRDLAALAERRLEEAARQDLGVIEFNRRASVAETDEARDQNLAIAAQREAARDALRAEAADMIRRSQDPNGFEEVLRSNPSGFINVNGGWLKLTTVGTNTAEAQEIIPMTLQVAQPTEYEYLLNPVSPAARPISDQKIVWIEWLEDQGKVEQRFNWRFFSAADSRDPELAGVWGAVVGSFWTLLVTFSLAFPIGVLAAIYLEEFAPKNWFTDFIEVNINNLAAVPSIVFGLLGLSVFITFFGFPRSASLAGGVTLALMTLPTIIIASRASIRAVPPSIRDAALGLGASKLQTSFHHVLPLAMPGILTGTIIGMAQALGETAPLILIGMVAFIVDVPGGVTDPATVLPVQVFRWSDFPERAFEARTAAAIVVLLAFLVIMNAIAVFLRKRFERRW
ncbi:MAG: phosphate ABC transporter permease PstA [Pseudomonadota bacterium]